jgi:hypothetical protein
MPSLISWKNFSEAKKLTNRCQIFAGEVEPVSLITAAMKTRLLLVLFVSLGFGAGEGVV